MRTTPSAPSLRSVFFQGWTLGFLFLSALGIGLVGWVTYAFQENQSRKHAQEQLAMVADLKVGQIQSWLEFQKISVMGVSQGTVMALDIERWIKTGKITEPERLRWQKRTQTIAQTNRCVDVTVLKPDGTLLLSSQGLQANPCLPDQAYLDAALRTRAPVITTVHRDEGLPGQPLSLDLVAPMIALDQAGRRTVGIMLFRLDPQAFLFPLVQTWPTPSRTAETLLGERRGDEVVFLNELRHQQGMALTYKQPIADREKLVVQAALGKQGLLEGVDYRNVPTLGASRSIPGTPWVMVAKMDKAELYQTLWPRTLMMVALACAFVLAAFLAVWSWMRQRSASLLLAGEVRYQALFESMSDAVLLIGPDQRFWEVNQVACDRLGYTREELLNLGSTDINPPEMAAKVAETFAHLEKQGRASLETRHVRKDGTSLPVEIHARRLELDGRPMILSTARDITERQRAEREIKANQARLEAIFKSAGVGISMTDPQGRYVEFNPKWAEFLGYTPDEIRQLTNLEITHPEDREATRRQFEGLLRSEIASYVQEKRYVRKDGQVVWGLLSVTPIRDAQGSIQNLIGIVSDITARKRMEAELTLVNDRLSLATQGAGIGIWDWDVVNNVLVWDDEMYRLYGIEREAFRGAYEAWIQGLDPEDKVRGDAEIQAALKGEKEFAPEFKVRWPDGSVHHLKASAKTLRDGSGKPLRMVGINFDITTIRKVEAKQRLEEARLRALMMLHEASARPEAELIQIGIEEMAKLTGSSIAYLHFVNPDQETLELVAWNQEALKDCTAAKEDHYPLSRAGVWADCFRQRQPVIHNDYQSLPNRHGYPEGHTHLVNHLSVPIFDGDKVAAIAGVGNKSSDYQEEDARQLTLFVGGLWNLLHRKRAEQKLVLNERFLKTLAESLPGMVGYWTQDLRCAFANHTYQDYFGRKTEDMLGASMEELLGKEIFRQQERHIRAVLGGESQVFERSLTRTDGTVSHILAHYIPDREGDTVRGFVVLVSDITELKDIQLKLEEANQRLKERTRQAEAANRAKSDFLANMSHEIRTPMNAIMGLCHLTLRTELAPKQKDYLNRIQDSSRLLLGILNDILDLSKIEAGKIELERAAFNLRNVLVHVHDLVAERAKEKGLNILFDLPEEVPVHLVGDSLRLSQILLNLANNAVKFTEQGQVSVMASLHSRGDPQLVLRFQVQDTGIGISSEVLSRLFQPFHQADSSMTRKFGGTGLGLAISKRLVELMGGEITAESLPGQGSTFSFTVPLGIQAAEALASRSGPLVSAPHPSTAAMRSGARGRILLAEDNETNRMVAQEMLESAGYQVETASNGREAVEKALASGAAIDLVLMDVQMPELDGLEATAQIRKTRKDLPILAMTAHALESERQRCLDAGMNDHLSKPFEPEALYAALERWIRPRKEAAPRPPLPGFDTSGLLAQFKGDARRVAQLMEAMGRDLSTHLAALQEALAKGDSAKAGRAAHSLKGMSGVIPAPGIHEAARALEEAIRTGTPWQERARALEAVLVPILPTLPTPPPPEELSHRKVPDLDLERLAPLLRELDHNLQRKSLSARRNVEILKTVLGYDPQVLHLEASLTRLDFLGAGAILAALAKDLGLPLMSP